MVAFMECAELLNERFGPGTAHNPFIHQQLTMYAVGEPCPMDTMAMRFAKYGEIVWAVSHVEAHITGWPQPAMGSAEIQSATNHCEFGTAKGLLLPSQYGGNPITRHTSFQTRIITNVAHDKMLPYFGWKRNPSAPCPPKCARNVENGECEPVKKKVNLKTLRKQLAQAALEKMQQQ